MLIEKIDSEMADEAVRPNGIAPFAPLTRSRASNSGFKPLLVSDFEVLREFYIRLNKPVADLNALMMLAWRHVLDLHLLVEDDVLYVVANWEGGPMLWGPPIGRQVSMEHVLRAFELLHQLAPENPEPVIAYLWDRYHLWDELVETDDIVVVREDTEYIYDSHRIATLAGSEYKKKRKDYFRFQEVHHPKVVEYSDEFAPACLRLVEKWLKQKSATVSGDDWQKLSIESEACKTALHDGLSFSGVIVLVEGEVRAFSIGGPHGANRFNCMFEKTDLDFPQAPAFAFSELAKKLIVSYSEITLGEAWHVDYLAHSKDLWRPIRKQASYYIQERSGQLR